MNEPLESPHSSLPEAPRPPVVDRVRQVVNPIDGMISDDRRSQEFVLAWEQVVRYREYLAMICVDYTTACTPYHRAIQERIDHFATKERDTGRRTDVLTAEELAAMEHSAWLGSRVHLTIETFYVFASVLLDRTAQAIVKTFGPARGVRIRSHSNLVARLPAYADVHDLSIPPGLLELARSLEDEEAHFWDKRVVHEGNPRVRYGSGISDTGEVTMNPFVVYPSEKERLAPARPSGRPTEMIERIDRYLALVLDFVYSHSSQVGDRPGGTVVR